jgi:hypothetical protein
MVQMVTNPAPITPFLKFQSYYYYQGDANYTYTQSVGSLAMMTWFGNQQLVSTLVGFQHPEEQVIRFN